VQRSIMNGDDTTGVSVMVLTEGMDEGPVIVRREEPIAPDDSSATVGSRLAVKGAEVLVEALDGYLNGSLVPQPQDDAEATYAPKLTTEDARIDWSADARSIRDLVRALDPHPGAWTTLDGQRIKVLKVHEVDAPTLSPGEIAAADDFLVGTGSGPLVLDLIQPATKRAMSGADFVRGARPGPNARMGS
jgi:methionyl-tRNA formyltransferase